MSDHNDEEQSHGKYGGWSYRVISELWTCPDDREAGHRLLTIGKVYWNGRPALYPIHEDIFAIELDHDGPAGHTIEELETDLGRMRQALDEPALFRAEWVGRFTVRRQSGSAAEEEESLL